MLRVTKMAISRYTATTPPCSWNRLPTSIVTSCLLHNPLSSCDMYCPVDGAEFREGTTRCPEHDVDLVDEPPDLGEPLSWVERFTDRTAVRLSFLVFLIAAVVYALAGVVSALIVLMVQLRQWRATEPATVLYEVQSAAFPVAVAGFGALAGALVLRTYLVLSQRQRVDSEEPPVSDDGTTSTAGPIPSVIMRLLFALTIVFSLMWAVTGIATSRQQAEYSSSFAFGGVEDKPGESYITLQALNYVGYSGGVTSLAIMGAGLVLQAHERGRRREGSSR